MNIEDLFATVSTQLRGNSEAANADVEKTASDASVGYADSKDENMNKIASELYAGGQIMAEGFIDRFIEKLAGSGVPAAGAGINAPRSGWESIAKKVENMHNRPPMMGGGSLSAEQAGALSGAKGVVNPAKPLV
jgi:hypothetical protein